MTMGIYITNNYIPYYGLWIAAGILTAMAAAYFLTRFMELNPDQTLLLTAYGIGGGLIGAKLLYLFVMRKQICWDQIFEWSYFQKLMRTGYVFYGGLIGGILAVYAGGKIHKFNARKYLEACILCIPLAHGIGRVGCHFSGCCYGIRYNGPCHIVYQISVSAPCNVPLFPVQLFEACINFLIAAGLLIRQQHIKKTDGNVCIYLFSYSVARFLLETFLRDDPERGKWMLLSTSQWISLILIAFVIFYWMKHNCFKIIERMNHA